MLRSDQVYDQLDELRSGTTRLTDAQAAAIAKAGIDSTRLGTGEARKIAEALLAKSNADPRKTDGQRPPRGNRPPGSGGVERQPAARRKDDRVFGAISRQVVGFLWAKRL